MYHKSIGHFLVESFVIHALSRFCQVGLNGCGYGNGSWSRSRSPCACNPLCPPTGRGSRWRLFCRSRCFPLSKSPNRNRKAFHLVWSFWPRWAILASRKQTERRPFVLMQSIKCYLAVQVKSPAGHDDLLAVLPGYSFMCGLLGLSIVKGHRIPVLPRHTIYFGHGNQGHIACISTIYKNTNISHIEYTI